MDALWIPLISWTCCSASRVGNVYFFRGIQKNFPRTRTTGIRTTTNKPPKTASAKPRGQKMQQTRHYLTGKSIRFQIPNAWVWAWKTDLLIQILISFQIKVYLLNTWNNREILYVFGLWTTYSWCSLKSFYIILRAAFQFNLQDSNCIWYVMYLPFLVLSCELD